MPFNNYFNWGRFSRLLKQDLVINRNNYLLAVLALGLVTYILFYFFLNSNQDNMIKNNLDIKSNYALCFVLYSILVGFYVGTAFPDLSSQIRTNNYLLTPGSTLEKFMVQLLIRIGIFIPVALFLFWISIRLAKASLVPGESGLDPAAIPYFEWRLFISNNYTNKLDPTWQILFMSFGFFSYWCFLFAGTTCFKRHALIKTIISLGVLWMLCILVLILFSHIYYPTESHGWDIQLNPFVVTDHLNSFQFAYLLLGILPWLFFLSFGYFKLKEREA